ncbi:hypothetical protein SAMN05421821_103191 [Mucilaginibacter lappiensis]|uniref:Uncharacterized protein n=1 Tax=Mucilaginibacter lappiensis TaxID=354630 RepID=A0ABR6PGT0_9SPHI|nr:hypothetical protein [Mucilaginibacter lappiensis]MBB6108957.1 hypothetical protein [Mucilaginibacter lappiensis]SIQ69351.1 hypothetical protein SAMN05421821_103191 [Mucilaginibacter lappiensis]
MIEKTLKTTTGKLSVKIPTELNEVTLGQIMAMQQKPDLNDIEAISILSGIITDELYNVKNIDDFQVFTDTVLALSHQIKQLYNSEVIPKEVVFILYDAQDRQVQKNVKVSHDLSVEPAGAFMAARDIIAEEINNHIKQHGDEDWQERFNPSLSACCQVLAHYFFCRATGQKYNEYEAEEFCNEIKKMRVTEALPIARHFFSCYPSLSKPKTSCWHRLLPCWKNGRVSSRSRNLNISTQLTHWPAAM